MLFRKHREEIKYLKSQIEYLNPRVDNFEQQITMIVNRIDGVYPDEEKIREQIYSLTRTMNNSISEVKKEIKKSEDNNTKKFEEKLDYMVETLDGFTYSLRKMWLILKPKPKKTKTKKSIKKKPIKKQRKSS